MHFLLQTGEVQIAGRKIHLGLDAQTKNKSRQTTKRWSQLKDIFTQLGSPVKIYAGYKQMVLNIDHATLLAK